MFFLFFFDEFIDHLFESFLILLFHKFPIYFLVFVEYEKS